MHSIKNTVVAVGLLGLSFVFYHFSSSDRSNENETSDVEMTSLADHDSSEGAKRNQLALPNPISDAAPKPMAGSDDLKPRLEQPTLKPGTDLDLDLGLEPPKMNPTGGRQPGIEKNQFAAPQLASPDFTSKPAPMDPGLRAGVSNGPSPDAIARDRELINALKTQNKAALAVDDSDNSFAQKAGATMEAKPSESNGSGTALLEPFEPIKIPKPKLTLATAWPQVEQMVKENRLRESLQLLTKFYKDPGLSGPQQQRLNAWLDGLAAKVIFSAEHRMANNPYKANGEETLEQIASQWKLPAKLVYNVNQKVLPTFDPSTLLPAGTTLKKIPGPFRAEINFSNRTLTMFVGGLYAGRFPVRVGIAGQPRPGTYRVMMKSPEGATWIDADGNRFPPSSPHNGYGPFFLGLEGKLCIHAVGDDKQDGHFGCLGLTKTDAEDVFSILSVGSTVTIVE